MRVYIYVCVCVCVCVMCVCVCVCMHISDDQSEHRLLAGPSQGHQAKTNRTQRRKEIIRDGVQDQRGAIERHANRRREQRRDQSDVSHCQITVFEAWGMCPEG